MSLTPSIHVGSPCPSYGSTAIASGAARGGGGGGPGPIRPHRRWRRHRGRRSNKQASKQQIVSYVSHPPLFSVPALHVNQVACTP